MPVDTTAYFGKYLNPPAMTKYCRNETLGPLTGGWPSGWDTFYGMCDQASTPEGAYYDVNWVDSVAGEITHTGTKPEECASQQRPVVSRVPNVCSVFCLCGSSSGSPD